MSFQGDVGGIGLADLLQSLARGRDGVLTLSARGNLRATLGIQDGQLYLLPDAEEDAEIWRHRVRQAWIKDPDFRIDALRMTDIARAQRIETVYALLDSEQVHFRFAHGPIPQKPELAAISASEPGTDRNDGRRDGVFCAPLSVEALLLEYARLKDEAASANVDFVLPEHALFVITGKTPSGNDFQRLFEEIDAHSTVIEVADRLGWPLRQARNLISVVLVQGLLRPASLPELFDLAARELIDGHFARSGTRLRSWIEFAPPGPLSEVDAAFFQTQWLAGRLQSVLPELPRSQCRCLLRRMEVSQPGMPARELWTEFLKVHQGDRLAAVSLLLAEIRGADPLQPALKDIITVAKSFQLDGFPLRAAALWRVAAARNPESIEARLEVGLGLLAAGLNDEGIPWIVDAAGTLIEKGQPELAVEPLRRAVEADATHRDARRLLTRARTQVVQRTITRKNSLVTIAIVVALSIGAVVTYRVHSKSERRFAAVLELMNEPHAALKMLEERFAGDDGARVQELRSILRERCKAADNASRTAWTDRYREAQLECTIGDAKLGLARALELPAPPQLMEGQDPLPLVSDLFNGLSARLEKTLADLGPEIKDTPEQVQVEGGLLTLVGELRSKLDEKNAPISEARELGGRLTNFEKKIHEREQARQDARTEKARKDNLLRQDLLLATARTQEKAGDYARALDAYQQLLESDRTGKLKDLLKKEMDQVVQKGGALIRARELALAGKHAEAIKLLQSSVDTPTGYALPWKLESFPSGARVHLKDGSERSTPCSFETSIGEKFDLTLELEGCEGASLHVDGPAQRFVYLSRTPDRSWKAQGRVEALPAAVGADHILCDRAGNVVRLSADPARAWKRALGSLSGVARTPLPMPGDAGHLLLLSEDGECWLLDVATGGVSGPKSLRSPPLEGPIVDDGTAVARLRDGSLALWHADVTPEVISPRELGPEHAHVEQALSQSGAFGAGQGLSVLRRRTDSATSLASADGQWNVEITAGVYLVRRKGAPEPRFCAARQGEWTFLAWQAPSAEGGASWLWIADEAGLRGFRP